MWLQDFIFGTKEPAITTPTAATATTSSVKDVMATAEEIKTTLAAVTEKVAKLTADIEALKSTEVVPTSQGGGARRRRRTMKHKRRTN